MFGSDRDRIRAYYVETWRKARAGEPLDATQRLVAAVIHDHPEYQPLLAPDDQTAVARDFPSGDGQSNPFLHMGLHIALREQANADRPPGIRALIERLVAHLGDRLEAEHVLMEPLGETLWEAQRAGVAPDETAFLERVRALVAAHAGARSAR